MSTTIEPMTYKKALADIRARLDSEPALFQPSRVQALYPRAVATSSWLVSKHGVALFVTESEEFMTWFVKANPGAVIEEVTGNVPAALARTAG